jgi:hypothetical protein
MAQEPPVHFDDPGLRAALHRAHAGEKAPPGLRERISSALAAEAAAESITGTGAAHSDVAGRIGRASRLRVAASIIALLGVGMLSYTLYNEYARQWFQPVMVAGLPAGLTHQMVERHDAALADANFTSPKSPEDIGTIGNRLSAELGKPVAAVSLGNGWTVKGGNIATVGKFKAAQILFQRGPDTISMLSIPITEGYTSPDGTRYDEKDGDHLIAGVVQRQVVYCLVGLPKSGSLSSSELKKLRELMANHLQQTLPPSSCAPADDQGATARRT